MHKIRKIKAEFENNIEVGDSVEIVGYDDDVEQYHGMIGRVEEVDLHFITVRFVDIDDSHNDW